MTTQERTETTEYAAKLLPFIKALANGEQVEAQYILLDNKWSYKEFRLIQYIGIDPERLRIKPKPIECYIVEEFDAEALRRISYDLFSNRHAAQNSVSANPPGQFKIIKLVEQT